MSACVGRYQQLRAQLMKTAVGRSALLSGVPEMELDMAEIASILQVRACSPGANLCSQR